MSFKVEYTEAAHNDIRAVYEYIAFNLYAPKAAASIIKDLMEEISALDENPLRYALYNKEPWLSRGLRHFAIRNYTVFYLTDETKEIVSIARIMYGGRDIEKQLGQ